MDIKNINAKGNNITHTIEIVKIIKQLKNMPLTADLKDTNEYMRLLQLVTSLTNIYVLANSDTVDLSNRTAAPLIIDTERFGLSLSAFTSFERCIIYTNNNNLTKPPFFIKATELTDDKYKSIFTYAKEHAVDTLLINDGTESLPLNIKELITFLESSTEMNKYKDDKSANKTCDVYETGPYFTDIMTLNFGPLKKIDYDLSIDFILAGTVLFSRFTVFMGTKNNQLVEIGNQDTFNTIQFLDKIKDPECSYLVVSGSGDFFGGTVKYSVLGPQDVEVIIVNPTLKSISSNDEFDTWSIRNLMNIIENRATYTNATRSALKTFAMFKEHQNSIKIEDVTANSRYLNSLNNMGVTDDIIRALSGNNSWTSKKEEITPSGNNMPSPQQTKTKIKCFACGEEWDFDDSKIPTGERYEVTCPKCKMQLRRKKV